jgi:hypothetical protein
VGKLRESFIDHGLEVEDKRVFHSVLFLQANRDVSRTADLFKRLFFGNERLEESQYSVLMEISEFSKVRDLSNVSLEMNFKELAFSLKQISKKS